MDMMQIRKMVMAQMANIPGSSWKETKVTYHGQGISKGDALRTWLNNNIPTCTVCVAVVENAAKEAPETDNQFVMAFKAYNTTFIQSLGCRYRNNSYANTQLASTYDVILSNDDVVTFLYLE